MRRRYFVQKGSVLRFKGAWKINLFDSFFLSEAAWADLGFSREGRGWILKKLGRDQFDFPSTSRIL